MAQFTNQAQLRYGTAVANSNIAVGEIQEVLSAAKTAVDSTYSRDGNTTFAVSIVNSGDTALTDLTVTDNLGAYTFGTQTLYPLEYIADTIKYYVNGTLQTAPTVTAGPPLVISGISVPANGNAILVYEAALNEYAPFAADSTITNSAVVSGTGLTSVTATETVTAQTAPELTVTKSVSPVPVVENGTLTYTFVIQNYGNTAATADTDAVITDTFNPLLSNLSVTFNGTAWTAATQYTYDATTGVFSSTAGEITVPAATYTQDSTTGAITVNPGVSTLVISGTV